MPRVLRLVFLTAMLCSGWLRTASARPDPTAAGPFPIGFARGQHAHAAVDGTTTRTLDLAIWYPATLHGEASGPFGYADAALRSGRHPVVIYSHGGCAFPEVSSFLTMALASWGFVVIAPSHPGDTVYDGFDRCDLVELRSATLQERVADVRATLDALLAGTDPWASRFRHRLARSRIGIAGWSSGASTAIAAHAADRRFRATLSLAPDVRPERIGAGPFGGPTMVMVGDVDFYDPTQTALTQLYPVLRAPRFGVGLLRTGHFAFSDACVAPLIGGMDCGPGTDTLDQDTAHRLVLRFAVPFLQHYVAGRSSWGSLLNPRKIDAGAATLQAQPQRQAR